MLPNGETLRLSETKSRPWPEQNPQEQQQGSSTNTTESQLDVQTKLVEARRVMMPTYMIDYSIFGFEFRAFVSGCDEGAKVSGVSHLMSDPSSSSKSPSFVSTIMDGILKMDKHPFGLEKLLLFRPLFSMILSVSQKTLQPWRDSRLASAEWEREREHEALMLQQAQHRTITESHQEEVSRVNIFSDTLGTAKSHFSQNRLQILRYFSGGNADARQEGTNDEYKKSQELGRNQWEQEEEVVVEEEPLQQQQIRTTRQNSKPIFVWGFDESDPYFILGIHREATEAQVLAAFRKETLKHHANTQHYAKKTQKLRAVERCKNYCGCVSENQGGNEVDSTTTLIDTTPPWCYL
jgi:hypothetical protein